MNEMEAQPFRNWIRRATAQQKDNMAELKKLALNKEQHARLEVLLEWRLSALDELDEEVSKAIHKA